MEGLSGMMIRAGGALLSSRNWGQRGETDGGRRIRGRMSLELDDDKEAGNDDGDGEDDDYDTGEGQATDYSRSLNPPLTQLSF
jgi:hypothetical protein